MADVDPGWPGRRGCGNLAWDARRATSRLSKEMAGQVPCARHRNEESWGLCISVAGSHRTVAMRSRRSTGKGAREGAAAACASRRAATHRRARTMRLHDAPARMAACLSWLNRACRAMRSRHCATYRKGWTKRPPCSWAPCRPPLRRLPIHARCARICSRPRPCRPAAH